MWKRKRKKKNKKTEINFLDASHSNRDQITETPKKIINEVFTIKGKITRTGTGTYFSKWGVVHWHKYSLIEFENFFLRDIVVHDSLDSFLDFGVTQEFRVKKLPYDNKMLLLSITNNDFKHKIPFFSYIDYYSTKSFHYLFLYILLTFFSFAALYEVLA